MIKLFEKAHTLAHPRYVSHRGFMPLAPENSLPSFAYAGRLHQWAIETDVHMTRDGVLVCCHNATVETMYNGEGAIADMTWQALSRLRLKCGSRLDCFADEEKRMPLFSEYLAICRRYGCVPFIEMKTMDGARVAQAVREAGFDDSEIVMSACGLERLLPVRDVSREMFIHLIFAKEEELDSLAALGNAGMSWNIPDSFSCPPEKIAQAHERGLLLCLRAGDSVASVRHMFDLGLDYIPTNCMHA